MGREIVAFFPLQMRRWVSFNARRRPPVGGRRDQGALELRDRELTRISGEAAEKLDSTGVVTMPSDLTI